MKGLSLRRNAAWSLLGQVVFAASYWGGFIVLGRLAGPEELGRYALALAVVTPIMLFGRMQMRELLVVDATGRYRFEDYCTVRLASTLCAAMIVLAIALFGYSWKMAVPILLVGLARVFESMSQVHYGLAQRHKRLDLVARSVMLRGVLGLLALGFGYYLTEELEMGLVAMSAAWGLIWFLDWAHTKRWRERSESEPARQSPFGARLRLAWTATPLGIAMLLVTLNPNIPRYFIEAAIGLEALGLFAAMAHFVVAGRMIINAFCQAASPRLADFYAAGELADFRQLLLRLMGLSLLPGLAGILVAATFGPELLGLVYGPQFAAGADIFPWIMLVGAVLYVQTPLGYGLTAMHQFKIQPVIFGLVVTVNAMACLVLVPWYGLLGATFAWLGSIACQLILSVAVHWRRLRVPSTADSPSAHQAPS